LIRNIESELSGVPRYLIPLTASAARVQFIFDDASPLLFGRLPLGEIEVESQCCPPPLHFVDHK
jgi:hypothetical protein